MSSRKRRTQTLMRVLTRQVRAVSLDQATRILRSLDAESTSVGSLLGRLHDEGVIETTSVAVAYPRVQNRILMWRPHHSTPKHEHTRWLLERRWADVIPEAVPLYWATKKAERFYGGVAGLLSHAGQLEHDLGTAEVLTVAYEENRHWMNDWIGEDLLRWEYPELARRLRVRPDAVTLDKHGDIFKAIEFGGQYSVDRLRRLHESFERQRIRYEIW